MTGINGKKNKTKKSIVLFDKSIAIEEIKSILKDTNSSIISLDFESFELLQKNNINQKTYDEFLKICSKFTNKEIFKVDENQNVIQDKDGEVTKLKYDNT